MNQESKKLKDAKTGDVLVSRRNRENDPTFSKIERRTKFQFILENGTRILIRNGELVGDKSFYPKYYAIATEDDLAEERQRKLKRQISETIKKACTVARQMLPVFEEKFPKVACVRVALELAESETATSEQLREARSEIWNARTADAKDGENHYLVWSNKKYGPDAKAWAAAQVVGFATWARSAQYITPEKLALSEALDSLEQVISYTAIVVGEQP